MGMDVDGLNPKIIGKEPVRPDNLFDFPDDEIDAYFDALNEFRSMNPGVYFRASIWSWRPIMEAMWESGACYEVDENTWHEMNFNSGAGAKDQETCDRMVRKLKLWMQETIFDDDGKWTPRSILEESNLVVDEEGKFVNQVEAELKGIQTRSVYSVSESHLKSWITFLENCGGFKVW